MLSPSSAFPGPAGSPRGGGGRGREAPPLPPFLRAARAARAAGAARAARTAPRSVGTLRLRVGHSGYRSHTTRGRGM